MARSSDNNTSNWLSVEQAPVTTYPLTIAGWVYPFATDTPDDVLFILNTDVTNYFGIYLNFNGAAAPGIITATVAAPSGGENSASTTGSFTVNTWTHAAAVFSSSTLRTAYRDGGNSGINTTSVTPAGVNRTNLLGARLDPTTFGPMNGRIAEFGIWNVALTANEVAVLADGVAPHFVRPANLVAYWPLWGNHSPEPDLVGGFNLTVNGSPPKADHTRVLYYNRRKIFLPAASGQTHEIESALTTSVTVVTNASLVTDASSALTTSVTVVTNASLVTNASSALTASATLAANASLVTNASSALTTSVTVAANASLVTNASSALTASVTVAANASLVKETSSALTTSVTVAAGVRVKHRFSVFGNEILDSPVDFIKDIKLGDTIYFDATTHSPTSGELANADSITFEVYEESSDTAVLTGQSMSLRSGQTGNYKGNIACTSANGLKSGKWYSVIIAATIESRTAQSVLTFHVVNTELQDTFIDGSISDASPSTTDFNGDNTLSSSDDFYNDSFLIFTSGSLKGIARKISDYTGLSRNFSFATGFPDTPADGDNFVIKTMFFLGGQATVTVETSLSATASVNASAGLILLTQSNLTVNATTAYNTVITYVAATDLSSSTQTSCQGFAIFGCQSSITATVSLTNATAVTYSSATNLVCETTFNAAAVVNCTILTAIVCEGSTNNQSSLVSSCQTSLSSTITLSAEATSEKEISAELSGEVTLVSGASVTYAAATSIATTSEITADSSTGGDVSSSLTAVTTVVSEAVNTYSIGTELITSSQLDSNGNSSQAVQTNITAEVSLESNSVITRSGASALETNITFVSNGSITRSFASALESDITVTPQLVVSYAATTSIVTSSSFTGTIRTANEAESTLVAQVIVVADSNIVASVNSDLNNFVTCIAQATITTICVSSVSCSVTINANASTGINTSLITDSSFVASPVTIVNGTTVFACISETTGSNAITTICASTLGNTVVFAPRSNIITVITSNFTCPTEVNASVSVGVNTSLIATTTLTGGSVVVFGASTTLPVATTCNGTYVETLSSASSLSGIVTFVADPVMTASVATDLDVTAALAVASITTATSSLAIIAAVAADAVITFVVEAEMATSASTTNVATNNVVVGTEISCSASQAASCVSILASVSSVVVETSFTGTASLTYFGSFTVATSAELFADVGVGKLVEAGLTNSSSFVGEMEFFLGGKAQLAAEVSFSGSGNITASAAAVPVALVSLAPLASVKYITDAEFVSDCTLQAVWSGQRQPIELALICSTKIKIRPTVILFDHRKTFYYPDITEDKYCRPAQFLQVELTTSQEDFIVFDRDEEKVRVLKRWEIINKGFENNIEELCSLERQDNLLSQLGRVTGTDDPEEVNSPATYNIGDILYTQNRRAKVLSYFVGSGKKIIYNVEDIDTGKVFEITQDQLVNQETYEAKTIDKIRIKKKSLEDKIALLSALKE